MMERQHCPVGATQRTGLIHSDRAIRPAPAPAVPTRPSPARAGMRPPARPAAAPAPATLLATPLTARRAKPPEQEREESDNYSESSGNYNCDKLHVICHGM